MTPKPACKYTPGAWFSTSLSAIEKYLQMAERGGFEPPNREDPVNGFRARLGIEPQ